MNLAVDIGNTTVTAGVFRGRTLLKRLSAPTYSLRQGEFLRALGKRYAIDTAVICSVVPSVTPVIEKKIKKIFKKVPAVVSRDIRIPIRNCYRKPQEVGDDRLVNAFGGVTLYGAPLIVIDFGTAVTFDVISAKREYLGGLILPGLNLSLDALAENTALLPRIELRRPKELIGRDTASSITSGVVYGVAAATDELIVRLRRQVSARCAVVATGGQAALIVPYCRQLKKVDTDLTLRGLNLLNFSHVRVE